MKKLLTILFITFFGVQAVQAQGQPKLHIKLIGGLHGNSYVEKLESIERDFGGGGQFGFGARVTLNKKFMVEFDLLWLRQRFQIVDPTVLEELGVTDLSLRWNNFEVPMVAGYVPVYSPFYKLYVYGGLSTYFNIKGEATWTYIDSGESETVRVRNKDVSFSNPVIAARMGIQMDLTFFNMDFNYNIGMNSATKTNFRTQVHMLQFNIGFVF